MFCKNCGNEIKDTAKFCPKCGAQNVPIATRMAQPANQQVPNGVPPRPQPSDGRFQANVPRRGVPTMVAPNGGAATAVSPNWGMPNMAPPQPKKSGKTPLIIAVACAVVVVIVAILVVVFVLPHNGSSVGSSSKSTTISVNGVTATSLTHDSLISLPEDSTMSATPALDAYKTSSSKSSTADSSSSSSGSSSGSSSNSGADSSTTYDLGTVTNISDFSALTDTMKSSLTKNGFVISATSNYYEFYEMYEMNRYRKLANYVTTDSMMHTYHLYFSYLLKNCEKNMLSSRLSTMSKNLLAESLSQREALVGTAWEEAANRNVEYFAVASSLMGNEVSVPAELADVVKGEVSKINAASGIESCALLGGDSMEDYSQYKPRGYYSGDDQLEKYFRTMMWYGRMNFAQANEDLDRSACLMTMAVHKVAEEDWTAMYTITSFFAGASDDCGYYEYYPIVEAVYGADATASDVANDTGKWNTFHQMTAQMPAPQINSVAYWDEDGDTTNELEEQKGFRLMGQRFTLDESIFENLLPDSVGDNSQGQSRELPSALDVTAALGSDTALSILSSEGETSYAGYTDNMEKLRTSIANSDDTLWTASLYSQWLYTLNPLLAKKDSSYPTVMQTEAWRKKDLQTYLGSYTELKHDTVLYAKQVMVEMGGQIPEHDDRGYVEPEEELYIRLANLTESTAKGLEKYDAISQDDVDNLAKLASLAQQLATISHKELNGEECSTDEYELIRSFGGQIEHFWEVVCKSQTTKSSFKARDFPAALVTDIATNATTSRCLEVGTGKVNTIYVLFQINGEWHIGAGATYSFYEFAQPISNRLTDTSWRTMMGIESSDGTSYAKTAAVNQPTWTDEITVRSAK